MEYPTSVEFIGPELGDASGPLAAIALNATFGPKAAWLMLTSGGASRERELTRKNSTLRYSLGAAAFAWRAPSGPNSTMFCRVKVVYRRYHRHRESEREREQIRYQSK